MASFYETNFYRFRDVSGEITFKKYRKEMLKQRKLSLEKNWKEIKTIGDFSKFVDSDSGKNALLHNNLDVKLSHENFVENEKTHVIVKDDYFAKNLAEDKIFHVFSSYGIRPLVEDCKQVITWMVQREKRVCLFVQLYCMILLMTLFQIPINLISEFSIYVDIFI